MIGVGQFLDLAHSGSVIIIFSFLSLKNRTNH